MGGLPKIAYAAGEPVLLTIDGDTLLAYEAAGAAAKWQLAFERPLVAIVFASLKALPHGTSHPWRSAASACEAVAIDVAGGIHAVDTTAGRVLAVHAAGGAPVAAAGRGDLLAIALADRVIVWRDGIARTIDVRAVALAFSRDGATLALATKKGDLLQVPITVDTQALAVTSKQELCVDVNALAAGAQGWLLSTDEGLRAVQADGATELLLGGPVQRAVLDVSAQRLAVQRSDTSITIYGAPPTVPHARIALGKGHHLVDIVFGEGKKLAVAIDRGDAAITDVGICTAIRTEPHAGRPVRAWSLLVEDEATRSARAKAQSAERKAVGGKAAFFAIGAAAGIAFAIIQLFCGGGRSTAKKRMPPPTLTTLGVEPAR